MKCYGRRAKLPGGRFGACMVRLEWTLKGKPALVRHLGGNQIDVLLTADLNAFLERNLRLARVDHVAVGKLFKVRRGRNHAPSMSRGAASPILKQWKDPKYRARRAAFLVLRVLAYRESARLGEEHALHVCQESPAQVRGYLRSLRQRGKPLTDYRINTVFPPGTAAARIIIAAEPKSISAAPIKSSTSNSQNYPRAVIQSALTRCQPPGA